MVKPVLRVFSGAEVTAGHAGANSKPGHVGPLRFEPVRPAAAGRCRNPEGGSGAGGDPEGVAPEAAKGAARGCRTEAVLPDGLWRAPQAPVINLVGH